MNDDDAVLVTSGLSQDIEEGGHVFEINIFRLEEEVVWTLEVVDENGTSHVWDDQFTSGWCQTNANRSPQGEARCPVRPRKGRATLRGRRRGSA
jgi:hypothetical protein